MKSYPDSVRFLYSLGNEIKAVKFGLETIQLVLERMGHPERAAKFVHVAGTNGKGSTCAMMDSALRAAGLRTGLYTSPHLLEPTERIRIDGEAVSAADFARAFDVVHEVSEAMLAEGAIEHHPTYFETVTAMAFLLFRERGVEWVVLETGLGGRLDATNVVRPEIAVITPIDYDHEAFLGKTIELIAGEKAGILKAGAPAVIAPQRPDAEAVLLRRAAELGCEVLRAGDVAVAVRGRRDGVDVTVGDALFACPLPGAHQAQNVTTAVLALRRLGIAEEAIRNGIATVRWPGRMERVGVGPEIVLDGAHNPAGVRVLAAHLREHYAGRKVWLIYGTMRDKSIGEIADVLFPLVQELILTAPDSPRSLDPGSLLKICGHPRARVAARLEDGLAMVRAEAAAEDAVFISGSLFLVGEARALLVQ
ncbi:MAG: bifunctional folylpolyglutamate synthase/dihydrofolate synthase [Acidobacteria bacterium]|nr:bifunctional folylpolyglutamate synthase/dihydrofolate synthase [Acidobacteriota bacterium]